MGGMFYNATNFNRPSHNWNVQNVIEMNFMFYNATNFNQNIRLWNTGNVSNYTNMFQNATAMISTYSNVTGFGDTPTSSFFNQPFHINQYGQTFVIPVFHSIPTTITQRRILYIHLNLVL